MSETSYDYHQWPLAPGVSMICTYGHADHGWKSAKYVGILTENGNATNVWWICEQCTPTLTIDNEQAPGKEATQQ